MVAKQGGCKKQRIALSPVEWRAIQHIVTMTGCGTKSEAIRMAVFQQNVRDQTLGGVGFEPTEAEPARGAARPAAYRKLARLAYESVVSGRRSRHSAGVPLTQWLMRLYGPSEQALLSVGRRWNLPKIVDVVRLSIRIQAALCGFEPPGGDWNATPTQKGSNGKS